LQLFLEKKLRKKTFNRFSSIAEQWMKNKSKFSLLLSFEKESKKKI